MFGTPRVQYAALVGALAVLGTSLTYTFVIERTGVVSAGLVVAWWLFAFCFVSLFAVRTLTGEGANTGGE